MTETIQLLRAHRSIRKFKDTPIPDEHLEEIALAAQAASTSSNIQAYSVVAVRNPERKMTLAELAGNQKHIEQSPLFLVWLADLNKVQTAIHLHEDTELQQNTELFLLATVDATLAAQNAAIAAESLGYGTVYIGGIRNNPQAVSEILELPPLVYPVFGLSIGVPDQEPDLRPRLPLQAFLHEEVYQQEEVVAGIKKYDETMRAYYASRAGGESDTQWSLELIRRFNGGKLREHLHPYLVSRGFDLK
ncbi:oxygen-insensitive NADPH nitroreductase [Paenibacillus sp. MMS18-CY102]|uniref:oxygen-insensitive NADPH nitroreductase n=1 Tax=Paenibacillus sp. MMS18-CY102 TaxID=2682849 RepID=UPI0013655343|nr:oxygen-insensitive NADPH nitroreductase [Paenibacillus sp. MMS18-CY102]MWC28070.1 oxygen-insensitive NADPH nitroreductase [Paenibacillus sp. MMS18-CY102]